MNGTPIHLHRTATLFHTDAGDITLTVAWLAADLAHPGRNPALPLVVELASDRDTEGIRYHLQCYVNLDSDLRPRSVGAAHAFPSPSTPERPPNWKQHLEAVRQAWTADVVALAPEIVTPAEVIRLYRNGAEGRLKAAETEVEIARQKLADAEKAARRAAVIREQAQALKAGSA